MQISRPDILRFFFNIKLFVPKIQKYMKNLSTRYLEGFMLYKYDHLRLKIRSKTMLKRYAVHKWKKQVNPPK